MFVEEKFSDVDSECKHVAGTWRKRGSKCLRARVRRNLLIDFLSICFGTGSWIAINGVYVQLPLVVQTAPEGWNLPSYLTVVTQVANIGPILYTVSLRVWPGKIRDSTIIHILLAMGAVALFLLAMFYKETTFLLGTERSSSMFTLVFVISIVGCTSSVLFMPYMGSFHEMYLISYFVGEGLSGFIPSMIALVQGMGENPQCINQTNSDGSSSRVSQALEPSFSTEVFFFILFGLMLFINVAFTMLNYLQPCENAKMVFKTNAAKNKCKTAIFESDQESMRFGEIQESDAFSEIKPKSELNVKVVKSCDFDNVECVEHVPISLFPVTSGYLLFLVMWVCLLGNGIFPSIQSFSCLPYGNTIYHLSAALGSMANPAACFMAFFLSVPSIFNISILVSICTVISCFIATTALTSPSPPLVNTLTGDVLIVLCWLVNTGVISFVKMSIASWYRREGGQGLFWCGVAQQMGSAIGALIAFALVNYANIFTSFYPCQSN